MRGSESAIVTPVSKHAFAKKGKRNPIRSQTMHLFPSIYGTTKRRSSVNREEGGVAFLNEGYASYLGLVQFFSLLFSGEEEGWGSGGCVYFSSRSEVLFMARGKGKKGKAVARGLRFAELGHKKPEKNLSLPNQALRAEKNQSLLGSFGESLSFLRERG